MGSGGAIRAIIVHITITRQLMDALEKPEDNQWFILKWKLKEINTHELLKMLPGINDLHHWFSSLLLILEWDMVLSGFLSMRCNKIRAVLIMFKVFCFFSQILYVFLRFQSIALCLCVCYVTEQHCSIIRGVEEPPEQNLNILMTWAQEQNDEM